MAKIKKTEPTKYWQAGTIALIHYWGDVKWYFGRQFGN